MRLFGLALVVCLAAMAQDTGGIVEGQVTDASGSVVAGAAVRAINTITGNARDQVTTNAGTYHLALPIGEYEVHVAAPNFAAYVRQHVQVSVSRTARVDVQLQVSRHSEIVNVTAAAPGGGLRFQQHRQYGERAGVAGPAVERP